MKKTFILILALVGIIGAATIFYNDYQKNDPSQRKPSGMFSDISSEDEFSSSDHTAEQNSETTNDDNSAPNSIPAIDFTVYTQNGTAVNLSDFYGKPIVINFWATWCGPCKSELPAFEQLYQEYGEDIAFMMVNLTDGAQETVKSVNKFVMDNGYHFPVYFDTEANAALTYSVFSIPATLFIDADSNIVASHMGAMSESTLRNYIETLLNSVESSTEN